MQGIKKAVGSIHCAFMQSFKQVQNTYLIIIFLFHFQGKTTKSTKKKPANLPKAPFRLSQNEMKIADTRAKNIRVPSAYGWKPKCFFLKKTYIKSHDWKQVRLSK